jgi:hypothetical protein
MDEMLEKMDHWISTSKSLLIKDLSATNFSPIFPMVASVLEGRETSITQVAGHIKVVVPF